MSTRWRISIIIILLIRCFYILIFNKPVSIIFPEDTVTVTGYISNYKEERISSNRYRLKILKYNDTEILDKSSILIVTDPYQQDLQYGNVIKITGSIENPKDFITDTGKSFDYDNYLKLSNIYGIMRDPKIEILPYQDGNIIKKYLFKIRYKFSQSLNKHLDQDSAVLSRGILLGEKSSITNKLRNNLAKTSMSHIIALSGYNITIVSEILIQLTKSFPLLFRTVFGMVGILLFVIMAGAESSALRAMIMAFILLYTRSRGKSYNALWALFISFIILISINPNLLIYDMGLHLSVLATFGLIVFHPYITAFFIKKHLPRWLSDTLASTISATIMTMPYIVYNMGIISITGLIVNIMIVPLLPVLMLFSFLTGLIGQFTSTLVLPFSYVTYIVSKFILWVINYFGELPFSAIYKEHISMLFIIFIYGIIFYIAFKLLKNAS